MAQKTVIELTDDLDGSEADETVSFALRGVEFEIDLSAKNAAALDKALGKYISAARRAPRKAGRPVARRSAPSEAKEDLGAIRDWANAHGYSVASRGRIPAEVTKAFLESQG